MTCMAFVLLFVLSAPKVLSAGHTRFQDCPARCPLVPGSALLFLHPWGALAQTLPAFLGLGGPACAPAPKTLTVHSLSLCQAPLGKQSSQASWAPIGVPWCLRLEFPSLCAKSCALEVCPSSHALGRGWKPTFSSGLLANWPQDFRESAGLRAMLALGAPPPGTGVPLARLGPF